MYPHIPYNTHHTTHTLIVTHAHTHTHTHTHTQHNSTFAAEYLHTLTAQQLDSYDLLINKPGNEWQLYYWITGKEEAPSEYSTDVLELLKQHTRNHGRRRSTALNPN